ncbi:hypothetical protein CC85DRAFT_302573 [Cutaneotrichosporon oleaginosum]|uniref:Uncharacterized protein n=1 Tax=Cutaneotrichosporon oleaginosum TaxID=879819 RepID=A0A0J0XMA8_9TREE|nr:uncharacterized protein CC85DRAFT_302573 [Cutaneotrichosporon oleaginosum]KLT42193.1 hypothetical protein CC85DRAFT_302573 [Cutaneotrichosporon oleaginosum]TXT11688.1 hypothetical protein COLE_02098 [Cutaneotrichosporon oleaginosum]
MSIINRRKRKLAEEILPWPIKRARRGNPMFTSRETPMTTYYKVPEAAPPPPVIDWATCNLISYRLIFENALEHLDKATLLALRLVCKPLRMLVDLELAQHLELHEVPIHPAFATCFSEPGKDGRPQVHVHVPADPTPKVPADPAAVAANEARRDHMVHLCNNVRAVDLFDGADLSLLEFMPQVRVIRTAIPQETKAEVERLRDYLVDTPPVLAPRRDPEPSTGSYFPRMPEV